MTKEDAHKLFIDFKNDKSLFKKEEDYKEYKYSFDEVQNYVLNQMNKGYILLSIKYIFGDSVTMDTTTPPSCFDLITFIKSLILF